LNTWQTELAEGREPAAVNGIVLKIRDLLPRDAAREVKFYDPWQNRWANGKLNADGALSLPQFKRSLVIKLF